MKKSDFIAESAPSRNRTPGVWLTTLGRIDYGKAYSLVGAPRNAWPTQSKSPAFWAF
jgi:hypothetical protein